jgi:hypothetical protein
VKVKEDRQQEIYKEWNSVEVILFLFHTADVFISQVCAPAIMAFTHCRKLKSMILRYLQWHEFCTKFDQNPSSGSRLESCG